MGNYPSWAGGGPHAFLFFLTLPALVHELLQTTVVDDFLKDQEETLSQAWKEKIEAMNEYKKYKPAEPKPAQNKPETTDSSLAKPKEDQTFGDNAVESNENKNVDSIGNEKENVVYNLRGFMTQQQKERENLEKEKERLEKERLKKEEECAARAQRVENANKNLERVQRSMKLYFRFVPLETDRNHSRYWNFTKVFPYLFLEKGCSPASESLPTSVGESPKKSSCVPCLSTTFPPNEQNVWFYYDSADSLQNMISSLITKGIGESQFKECLAKRHDEIVSGFETYQNSKIDESKVENVDAELKAKEFLRNELFSTECKIREGGLGWLWEFDDWKFHLDVALSVNDFAELLIEVQDNVRPTLLRDMMALKKVMKNVDDDEDEDPEEKSSGGEEAKRNKRVQLWISAFRECAMWSRLAVLFSMFTNCVIWEKSIEIENARCNKCRKNKDDDKVILCETCNAGYHIYCLRLPLKKIPEGDWFCEQRIPPSSRTRQRAAREVIESLSDDEESDEDEIQHDDVCARCSEGSNDDLGELILCATCPAAFHKPCHELPLRYTPRVGWRCCQCTNKVMF